MSTLYKAGSGSEGSEASKKRKQRKRKKNTAFSKSVFVGTKHLLRKDKTQEQKKREEFAKFQKKKERVIKRHALSKEAATRIDVKKTDSVVQSICESAGTHHLLEILYRDTAGKKSKRSIEPYNLKIDGRGIKLTAHCLLRKCVRTFYLKKIIEAYVTSISFSPQFEITVVSDFDALRSKRAKF